METSQIAALLSIDPITFLDQMPGLKTATFYPQLHVQVSGSVPLVDARGSHTSSFSLEICHLRPRGEVNEVKWQMNVELGEVNSETCREG